MKFTPEAFYVLFFFLILIFCNQMCILHMGHLSIWAASQVPKSHTRLMCVRTHGHRCTGQTDVGSHCSSLVWHHFAHEYFLLKNAAP